MAEILLRTAHLLMFGLMVAGLTGCIILEFHQRSISTTKEILRIFSLIQKIHLLVPISGLLLLLTGIVLLKYNFGYDIQHVFGSGWLTAKIILFAFLLVNGVIFGTILLNRRTRLLKNETEDNLSQEAIETLSVFRKNIATYYIVQSFLLILIAALSVYGGTQ
ncbi:MAG TPA: DUF2269 family protein [Bacteroidota bacterium]|nr:DUF2269 family protein [Bacteroidota bacterium]